MDKALLNTYLKKKGYAGKTIASYEKTAARFTAWAESKHLDSAYASYNDLLDYLSSLRSRQLTPGTIQTCLAGLNHYFEALTAAEIIPANPARYLQVKNNQYGKFYHILSKQQLENLYTTFDIKAERKTRSTARLSALRNKIATGLMIYQGLEVKALSRLRTEDADVLGGTIHIAGSRKYGARTLALQANQIIELDRYQQQARKELQQHFNRQDSDLLLITGYTSYADAHRKLMQRLRKQEPRLQSVQQIRASVITHWLKQYNLREVQYMAGHKSVHSTERYLQNDTESLQMDIDRFHPMTD